MDHEPSVLTSRPICLAAILLMLAACGGGGGSGGSGVSVGSLGGPGTASGSTASPSTGAATTPAPAPASKPAANSAKNVSVSLSASQTQIEPGQTITLNWQSANTSSCTASGGWIGSRGVSGAQVQASLQASTDYWLSCTDVAGVGAMAGVSVTVRPAQSLRIDFKAEPAFVSKSEQSELTWTASDATRCVSRNDWNGERPVQGRFDTGALSRTMTYTLECSNAQFIEVATVSVGVKTLSIEWQAPAHNEDGTSAMDIAGYRVFWGATPDTADGSFTINDSKRTSWQLDLPRGKYYFSVTAFDQDGNESEPSKPVLMHVS